MKIAIFGLGYVGFTAACCIASEGHEVIGVDVSEAKVDDINSGLPPFVEPGLDSLMREAQKKNLLRATHDPNEALLGADLAIVCVGTPSGPDGSHDMHYIAEVSRQIAEAMRGSSRNLTVAYRSTMRPGSVERLIAPIFEEVIGPNWPAVVTLVYNPEFLREAQAVHDYFNPPKIVIGTHDGAHNDIMDDLNSRISAPTFYVGYQEAELTKFVDNSWHAVKVAFANEIGRVCQSLQISATAVHEIFVSDTKLNISSYYTRPGGAFGGSCLPKDVRALQFISSDINANTHLIDSLIRSNEAHKNYQISHILSELGEGKSVLIAGLSFKADTDDLRESPNVDIARKLLTAGIKIRIFDPNLTPSKLRGSNLGHAYYNLPTIDALLIDKGEAEAAQWDLVIASNKTINDLKLSETQKIIKTYKIA